MNNSKFDKAMIIADVVICAICLFTHFFSDGLHSVSAPTCIAMILVRLWLGFLLYRHSGLSIAPIGVILVWLALDIPYFGQTLTTIIPYSEFGMNIAELFGAKYEYMKLAFNHSASVWEVLICSAWFIVIPVAVYIYRRVMLYKQGASDNYDYMQIGILASFILIVILGCQIFCSTTTNFITPMAIMALMVIIIPLLCNISSVGDMFTRGELATLMAIALIITTGAVGVVMSPALSAIALFAAPVALYALTCWHSERSSSYLEMVLIYAGTLLYWCAQYTTDMVRIALLFAAMLTMAIAIVRFAYATKRFWSASALYILAAIVVPMLCIGYNPYVNIDAKRIEGFDSRTESTQNLMLVEGEQGVGLRDRFHNIVPAKFDNIEIMEPTTHYCKCSKSDKFQIYDLYTGKAIEEEWYNAITRIDEQWYELSTYEKSKYFSVSEGVVKLSLPTEVAKKIAATNAESDTEQTVNQ